MGYLFTDLQTEVKRRAVRNQSGTQFDTAIKNLINTSFFRLSREALWTPLRRTATFDTEEEYETGTVTATNASKTVTGASTVWIATAALEVGRRMQIQGSTQSYIIDAIASNTSLTLNKNYDGTTGASKTYTVYGKEEYNLPIQAGRVAFLWHEGFGYPYVMRYVPSFEFYHGGYSLNDSDVPTLYKLWGEDDVRQQPLEASVMRVASSAAADTSIAIVVFGIVGGYPDFESISTNASDGTTAVSGSKSFTSVERVVKTASTTGRVTVDANSANVTVATLPVGNATDAIQYKKIRVYPFPNGVFPINVWYYKDPWRLVNNNDVHELGKDFDEAIILLCVAKLKAENSQAEAAAWFEMYEDEVKNLRKVNADKLDYFPTLERPERLTPLHGLLHPQLSYTQLGGSYGPAASLRR